MAFQWSAIRSLPERTPLPALLFLDCVTIGLFHFASCSIRKSEPYASEWWTRPVGPQAIGTGIKHIHYLHMLFHSFPVGSIAFRRGLSGKRAEALRLRRVSLGRVYPADPVEVMGRVFGYFPREGEVHFQDFRRVPAAGESQLRISVLDRRVGRDIP